MEVLTTKIKKIIDKIDINKLKFENFENKAAEKLMKNETTMPKINGQGTVSKPPWIPGDVYEWTSSETSFTCDVCNGQKIIEA